MIEFQYIERGLLDGRSEPIIREEILCINNIEFYIAFTYFFSLSWFCSLLNLHSPL